MEVLSVCHRGLAAENQNPQEETEEKMRKWDYMRMNFLGIFVKGEERVTVHLGENVKAGWGNIVATVLRQKILEHMGYSECRASGGGTLTTPKDTMPRLKRLTL